MTEAGEATLTAVPVRKHYAVWYGPVASDIYDCPVEDRDPTHYEMDDAADFFRFYDRMELDWEVDGKVIKLRSEPFNHSAFYVPEGRLLEGKEREDAFLGPLRWASHQQEKYYVVKTRWRPAVEIYKSQGEVVVLP